MAEAGGLDRLLCLFEAGWRRQGFGASDDELQYRDRAVAALARYHERHARSESTPVWLERSFAFAIGPHQLRGRVDRVDRLPDGGYELIDYKTGDPGSGPKLSGDVQLALYRLGAREAWQIEAERRAATGTCSPTSGSRCAPSPTTPSGSSAPCSRSPPGSASQDFEPRPSHEICSWCDYRLICPASEA